jgi:hypothetical protein
MEAMEVELGKERKIRYYGETSRCPELVTTIVNDKAKVSIDMSGIIKVHNQIAYNIESYIKRTRYI